MILPGSLVWWELKRLARRGDAARARVLLLYAMLLAVVGFAVVWSARTSPDDPLRLLLRGGDPLPIAQATDFAATLALVLLEAQLLLVAAVTPAYAAAALSEEKDRHTLPLLLTTGLTDAEIVWGKAVSRVLFVLAAVAAGIPVLMVTMLFGGVDVQFLAAGYSLIAGTAILSGAIGVSAACHTPDTRSALVRAYAQWAVLVGCGLIPPFVLCSPFAMLVYAEAKAVPELWRVACGFGYPLGQVAVAVAFLLEAGRALRRAGPTAGPPTPSEFPEPPRGRPAPVVFTSGTYDPPALPAIDDADPVLWKERHAGRSAPFPVLDRPARLLGAGVAVLVVALFVGGGWLLVKRAAHALHPAEAERFLYQGANPPDAAGGMLIAAGVLASALYLLPLVIGATGCVAGERFQGTLDALLSTPLSRREVLRSKLRAHAERGLVFAGGAAASLGAGFGADGGVQLGLIAVSAFGGGVGLILGLGAWLTVRCATPVRAFRLALPALILVVGTPVFAWNLPERDGLPTPGETLALVAAITAVVGGLLWWRAGVDFERRG